MDSVDVQRRKDAARQEAKELLSEQYSKQTKATLRAEEVELQKLVRLGRRNRATPRKEKVVIAPAPCRVRGPDRAIHAWKSTYDRLRLLAEENRLSMVEQLDKLVPHKDPT